MTTFNMDWPPPHVGHFVLTKGVIWHLSHRPHWWYRFWVRVFFGWRWVDSTHSTGG